MAKLADLTESQRKTLADFDLELRGSIVELFRALRFARASSQQYNATVLSIVSSLDGTEDLPTVTGLAGAVPLAKSDPGYLVSYLDAIVAYYDANLSDAGHQTLYVKSAGSINLVGS